MSDLHHSSDVGLVTDDLEGKRQLAQVVLNRRVKTRSQLLSDPLERILTRVARRADMCEDAVIAAVASIVDTEFMRLCTLGSVRNGVLVVLVKDARFVSVLRAQWGFGLCEGLRSLCPGSGIREIRFAVGSGRRLRHSRSQLTERVVEEANYQKHGNSQF